MSASDPQGLDGIYTTVPARAYKSGLRPTELAVFVALCSYAFGDKDTCFPGEKAIASQVGRSTRTVRRAIRGLEDRGLIQSKRRRVRETNIYTIPDRTIMSSRTESAPDTNNSRPQHVTWGHGRPGNKYGK